jgi:hypothetical protein
MLGDNLMTHFAENASGANSQSAFGGCLPDIPPKNHHQPIAHEKLTARCDDSEQQHKVLHAN